MTIQDQIWLLAHSKEPEDRREWAVLYFKSQGLTHRQIAEKLGYGKDWVQRYITSAYRRFGAPRDVDKDEKFEWLVTNVFPALREFIAGNPDTLKELPPPPTGYPPEAEDAHEGGRTHPSGRSMEWVPPVAPIIDIRPIRRRSPFLAIVLGAIALLVVGYAGYQFGHNNPLPVPTSPQIPLANPTSFALPSSTAVTVPAQTVADTPVAPTLTPIAPTDIAPSLAVSLAPANPVLFSDDFNSGISPAWKLISGQPSIVNGALTASEDTWLQVGDPSWKNIKITMEMMGNDCWFSSSFNAIGVRGDSPDNMITFRWANCENEWDIVSSGDWKQVANSRWQGNIWGPSTYVVEVKDSQFRASVAGQFNTSIILLNEDLQPGTIFLKLAPKTQLDSFKIEANP